jgi:hypothetical protein
MVCNKFYYFGFFTLRNSFQVLYFTILWSKLVCFIFKVIFNLKYKITQLIKENQSRNKFPFNKITYFSIIKIFYKMISDAQFKSELQILISNAIREDVGDGDHSSMACIPSSAQGTAKL